MYNLIEVCQQFLSFVRKKDKEIWGLFDHHSSSLIDHRRLKMDDWGNKENKRHFYSTFSSSFHSRCTLFCLESKGAASRQSSFSRKLESSLFINAPFMGVLKLLPEAES